MKTMTDIGSTCCDLKWRLILIMQQINCEIREFLKSKPSEPQLTDFINRLQPSSVKPTLRLHQTDLSSFKQPTVVSARLMVQDLREVYYYVSLAIRKGFQEDSPFYLYKYGNMLENQPEDVQDGQKYLHVMTDRFPVICTPVPYQTHWVNSLQASSANFKQLLMEVDGQADYKLGEIINVVAIYDPHMQKLFFVRPMTSEEVEQEGIDVVARLVKSEVNVEQARHELMSFLCNYCAETFAEYLLATMVSEECMFLGCEANLTPLITQLLPRVAHIKLVHPCNTSLFPFKNEEGQLQMTPMQLSSLRTFVILDLSEFSSQKEVILKGTELQNFSALKLFVEEAKTIYRWEIGESHVPHNHVGLIVKAAKLITPHFNPKDQCISPDLSSNLSQESKTRIRQYLQRVLSIDPKLQDDERKLIENELATEEQKQKLASNLGNIMKLSKLMARSHGRQRITYDDFKRSRELLEVNQPPK